jgi:hypothetical protein
MTELSPQAQAVLDAAFSAYWSAEQETPNDEGMIAAAALRAAAVYCTCERRILLTIADELEGSND